MVALLILLVCFGGAIGVVLEGANGMILGFILGFILWALIGAFVVLSQAYDGCDSLDPDDMCVDTGSGQVRP